MFRDAANMFRLLYTLVAPMLFTISEDGPDSFPDESVEVLQNFTFVGNVTGTLIAMETIPPPVAADAGRFDPLIGVSVPIW